MSCHRRPLLYTVVVLLVALLLIDCAEAFEPKVTVSELPGGPRNIVYFNDSSVILYHADGKGQLLRSEDDGGSWKEVKVDSPVSQLIPHPFDDDRAFAITEGKKHYATVDKGKNWKEFEIPHITGLHVVPLKFHAEEPDYMLLSTMACPKDDIASPECAPKYYYTTNSFKDTKELVDAHDCQFARSAKGFESGEKDTIACMINPRDNTLGSVVSERRLAISHDFFKSREYAAIDDNEEITGVVGFGPISKFFLCTVATRGEEHRTGDAVKLIVSKDLKKWDQARFSDERSISENAYTVLESSDTSLHVDVFTDPESSTGTFYTSNSDGTYFMKSLENTNRNRLGLVDMEKIEGIDGVLIANVVDKTSDDYNDPRPVRSMISYDDGRNWNYLKTESCAGTEHCGLNLHSVVDHRNLGRIFSSPAPGIIAGIGNAGLALSDYSEGMLHISRDSGLNWHQAGPDSGLYEFGDHGNVIVASKYEETDRVSYSLDGETWPYLDLKQHLRPKFLFTTPDSTSLKFVLVGQSTEDQRKFVSIAIDLTGVYDKKCDFKSDGSGDFEKWYARYNSKGEPNCLMGHKQYFFRKKANSECYVGDLYHEQHASQENCKCEAYDYECDERFMRQNDACIPTPEYAKELSNCKEGTKYKRPSGYRLIPGNTCDKKDGVVLDGEVEVECGKDGLYFSNGNITHRPFELDGTIRDYFYLKAENGDSDETIILRNNHHQVFVTHDQGGKWEQVHKDEEFIGMYPHPHFPNNVYLITPNGKIYYSEDRAHSFKTFQTPASLNTISIPLFSFHPKHSDWLLYVGEEGCSNHFSPNCKLTTYYTQDNGRTWNKLQEDCKQCRFVGGLKEPTDDNLIFCTKGYVKGGETKLKLVSSTNFFTEETTHFDDVIGYAHEQEFVVAATVCLYNSRLLEKKNANSCFRLTPRTKDPSWRWYQLMERILQRQSSHTTLKSISNRHTQYSNLSLIRCSFTSPPARVLDRNMVPS